MYARPPQHSLCGFGSSYVHVRRSIYRSAPSKPLWALGIHEQKTIGSGGTHTSNRVIKNGGWVLTWRWALTWNTTAIHEEWTCTLYSRPYTQFPSKRPFHVSTHPPCLMILRLVYMLCIQMVSPSNISVHPRFLARGFLVPMGIYSGPYGTWNRLQCSK